MSYPSVKVGDNLLQDARVTYLEVRQALNEHWWCTFTCGQSSDAPIPVQDWLGKTLEITSTDEQKATHTHFSGFVLSVDLVYEASGTFSAQCTAVTFSWLLDQAQHKQYYLAKTLSDVASTATGRVGLTAAVNVASAKPLNYVQYGETDFSFLHRITDDYKAWLRPTAKGVEVFGSFQPGTDLEWRGASGLGLLDFVLGGTLKPASFNGSHYDFHAMQSQMFQKVSKQPDFSSPSAGLASAVVAQSQAVMPAGFAQQRPRVMTLADFQTSVEDEAERALGSAITGRGSSRNPALKAGDTVNLTGNFAAAGTYGLVAVTHHWDAGGYSNTFTVTPWKQYRNSTEPPVRAWHGVVPAVVTAHNDPKKMGRVQVQFFWQDDGSTHWARATSPHAGPDRGFMFMPEVGDEVAVIFEDGDPERPIILGSLWNGVQQAPRYDFRGGDIESNDVKRLVTKSGNRIHLSDKEKEETVFLATPAHTYMTLTEKSNETGTHLILLHSDGDIVLNAPNGRVHINSLTYSNVTGPDPPPELPGSAAAPKALAPPAAPAAKEGFFHGLVGGLYSSTLQPLGHMVMHPVQTVEGVGHAVAHPIDTTKAVGHAIAATGRGVLSGDGRAIGTAIGTVGMLAVPGAGEAGAVEDAARVGQLGELGDVSKVGEVGDVADASKVGEVEAAAAVPGAAADPGAAVPNAESYPDFNPSQGDENCGACSDAVDNHLAGNEFQPAQPGPRAWPQNAPADSFDFTHSPASIEQSLQASGDGSRGIVYVADESGNSHVFNVVNKDGTVTAIDGQTGVNGSLSDVADHAGYGDSSTWGFSPTGKGK